jgi:diguanylate cyclase (GGDEF)-like protein
MQVLEQVKNDHPGTEVVVITALDKVDPAVRAIKSGASEYLIKPVSPEALQHAVTRALATRQLMLENERLRQHVALLETGQRIATTLERDRLVPGACTALAHMTGATAVLLFVQHTSGTRLEGAQGLPPDRTQHWVEQLEPILRDPQPPLKRLGPLEGFEDVWVLPALDSGTAWGHAVLLFGGPSIREAESNAIYLARHVGIALRTLGRFAEVEDLAYLDDLTHLFNVRYLELVLDREVESAEASGGTFSLLFLDLDHFKSVNDTFGHLVGSRLLIEVARVLKGCVRDNDVVVRYGGDEYVVMLRGTDSGGALKVAERIRRTMETHHFLAREGLGISITTCIGVASFPEHARDKGSLLDYADRAMYRGKKSSRNVVYMAASGLEATPADRHSPPIGRRSKSSS